MGKHTFRAITTRYKGYTFRSRLEARFAVYFDHLGVRWDYEPEGFELGNGLRYLPDFWLPDLELWVEIKPTRPDAVGIEKASRLAQAHRSVIMFCGPPAAEHCFNCLFFGWDQGDSSAGYGGPHEAGYFAHVDGKLALEIAYSDRKSYYSDDMWEKPIESFDAKTADVDWSKAEAAAEAARGARFEFGAEGGL